MANEAIASSQGSTEPLCGSVEASDVSKCAYHDGWPLDAETRVELIDPPARLAGRSHSTAESVQKPDQAMSGAMLPNGPEAAAEEGIPAATSSAPASVGTSFGQTSSPIKGYRRTAPGAPVSGDAAPVSSMPKPSPNHHTPKAQTVMTTMAGFTVLRKNMPTPMHSWSAPKRKFQTPASGRTKWASCVIDHDTGAGWPCAIGSIIMLTRSGPNMRGWNCSAASRIQRHPSAICTMRARCCSALSRRSATIPRPLDPCRLPRPWRCPCLRRPPWRSPPGLHRQPVPAGTEIGSTLGPGSRQRRAGPPARLRRAGAHRPGSPPCGPTWPRAGAARDTRPAR